jgi:hypothetical protein
VRRKDSTELFVCARGEYSFLSPRAVPYLSQHSECMVANKGWEGGMNL